MAYRIEFKKSARKEILGLPRKMQRRVISAIKALADNPRPENVRKLKGSEDYYRLRVGDYRILYQIADQILTIFVIRVGHRGDVYRKM